jgi:hypothetical protein
VELSYVYEVNAVEMTDIESQVLPEDESAISISAASLDTLDDEVMPFEARKGKSDVQRPEPGGQNANSDAKSNAIKSNSQQPRMFQGSDD